MVRNIYTIDSVFERYGYDERIDFIKGWCILCVVLNHCIENMKEVLFPLWGSPAVALFILIQVFHAYKKGVLSAKTNWSSIWKRILKPFLIVQFILITLWFLCYDMSFTDQLKMILYKGGKGPGTYYVWVYIQIAFLLPLFAPFLHKSGKYIKLITFVVISQLSEILFCILSCPDYLYVLLCPRYLFLVYLGFLLATTRFSITPFTIFLSLLSLLTLIFFSYSNIHLAPLFYNHPYFTTCHWPAYYYVSLLLLFLLLCLYRHLSFNRKMIARMFCRMGRQSYEIFLLQMAFFSVMDIFPLRPWFNAMAGEVWGELFYVLFSVAICVIPILVYSDMKNYKNEKKI